MIPEKCKFCGKVHSHPIQTIALGRNSLGKVVSAVTAGGYKRILIVADVNTYGLAGEKLEIMLSNNVLSLNTFVFFENELVPDETAVGRLIISLPTDADLIVGLGSGTINDLCRYVAFRMRISYGIVATAPSMDGYSSGVSPLISGGMKITYEAIAPVFIIGDTSLLETAPPLMHSAGVGDMLGKYTALCDWRLSSFVTGEYYCGWVAGLTEKSVEKCREVILDASQNSESCVEAVMEGLTGSGIAMSYAASSRPASGAEHHLSHFWEMMFLFAGRPAVLHGIKVGIATLVILKLHEMLWKEEVDFDRAVEAAERFNQTNYNIKIKEVYGLAADEIIRQEEASGRNSAAAVVKRIRFYRENWPQMWGIAKDGLPTYAFVCELLEKSGCQISPRELGIEREMFRSGILYAKELRSRYTVLQLAADLGLLEQYADALTEYYY